jgi:hypothetical protein
MGAERTSCGPSSVPKPKFKLGHYPPKKPLTNAPKCVLIMFVTASPPGPAPAAHPNPPHPQGPGQGGSRIGRVLGLLGRLILYGHDLADRLRQSTGNPTFARLALPFGTTDLKAILRSITRGLMLAIALHERLEQRAARGRDITPTPLRSPAPAAPCPRTLRAKPEAAPDVVALPTPQQIAALLRRRSLGAVLVEICHDLGIMPGDMEPELSRELRAAIIEYGGSLARYLSGTMDRALGRLPAPRVSAPQRSRIEPPTKWMGAEVETPQSSPPVPIALALATGPPLNAAVAA